jgi:hypothetical protein
VRGKRSGHVVRQLACGMIPTCMRINKHGGVQLHTYVHGVQAQ